MEATLAVSLDRLWFHNAAEALCWAEEMSQRPRYPNWFSLLGMPRGSVSLHSGGAEARQELAQTITLLARMSHPPEAANTFMLAHLQGPGARPLLAAVGLALRDRLAAKTKASGVSRQQRLMLAVLAARDFRARSLGHKEIARAGYARRLQIRRGRLYQPPWPELMQETALVLSDWYATGAEALTTKLMELGILTGDQ